MYSFEGNLDLRQLPMVICPGKCPEITDVYKSTLKEQHTSTADNLECSQFLKCFLDAADGSFVLQP